MSRKDQKYRSRSRQKVSHNDRSQSPTSPYHKRQDKNYSKHYEQSSRDNRDFKRSQSYRKQGQRSYDKYDKFDRYKEDKYYKDDRYSKNDRYNKQDRNDDKHQKQQRPQKAPGQPQTQTKTLCLQNFPSILIPQLQQYLTQLSLSIPTSLPDQFQQISSLLLIKYPSIQSSSSVINHLNNVLTIQDKSYKLLYHPIGKEDHLQYDWYCNKCDFKNFSRRTKCHKCDNQRNQHCKLNYTSQIIPNTKDKDKDQQQANCSLMIRGPIIMTVKQQVLLNIFQGFAPIKDIRMIRNKISGGNKDFAFVQFFSPDEAAYTLKKTNQSSFRICGQRATIMYSRSKADDDYYSRTTPFQRDRSGPRPRIAPTQPINYYLRQRQQQIQQQKKRPLITLQQLKQKRQLQIKKSQTVGMQLTEEQKTRRQAEMMAKNWGKETKAKEIEVFVCVVCRRRFRNQDQMNNHAKLSEVHRFRMDYLRRQAMMI